MIKRYIIGILAIIILLCGSWYFYTQRYSIEEHSIDSGLIHFFDFKGLDDPKILKFKRIDDSNTYFALFVTKSKNTLGYAVLEKGFNDNYRIDHAGLQRGGDNIEYIDVHNNEGDYGIVYGRNIDGSMETINVKLFYEYYSYKVDVSGGKKTL